MAKRKQKLKVFRTPIGFHDAIVAAPSRKAALEAWGASTDLFSAGIAELMTGDEPATKAALAKPGDVIRIKRTSSAKEEGDPRIKLGMTKRKARPKPSRAAVGKAEAVVAELEKAQAGERAALAKEEQKLAKRRLALDDKQRQETERAEAKRDAAKARYRKAMADWVG